MKTITINCSYAKNLVKKQHSQFAKTCNIGVQTRIYDTI